MKSRALILNGTDMHTHWEGGGGGDMCQVPKQRARGESTLSVPLPESQNQRKSTINVIYFYSILYIGLL